MHSKPHPRRRAALAVLALSLLIIGMDTTIVNVALPTLVRDLGATSSQLQWIVDAYVLVFAGLLLSMGALGDRFGRRRALDVGLLFFAAGSMASAWAGSAPVLIGTRALMGIGGALIMPSTLSIITDIFPAEERARAIAAWAATAGIGIVGGPVVGGWLLDHFWWGSVFLINIPVVTLALVGGRALVPESKDPQATPLDPVGAVLSIAGLGSVVYGIIQAPTTGWGEPLILGAFALGTVLLAAFVGWELRTTHPMLRMAFFRNARFSAASVAVALVFFALLGSIFVLTQQLQFVLGYSPFATGVRITPLATLVIAAPLSARLAERVGTKFVVASGLAIVAAAAWYVSTINVNSGYAPIGWTLALLGLGMGATMAPGTDSIMGSLPLAQAGVGSAMNDTTRMVGGALGVAVIGTVLSSSFARAISPALRPLPSPTASAARDSIGAALHVAGAGPRGEALAAAARAAYVTALGDAMTVAAVVAAAGALITLLFLPSRERQHTHPNEASNADEDTTDSAQVRVAS